MKKRRFTIGLCTLALLAAVGGFAFAKTSNHSELSHENCGHEHEYDFADINAISETSNSHIHLVANVNYACRGKGCTCDGFIGSLGGKYPMANACESCGHRRDWHTKLAKSGSSSGSSSSRASNHVEVHCIPCHGSGKCSKCNGDGYYYKSGVNHGKYKCDRCNGNGKCTYCHGTGRK